MILHFGFSKIKTSFFLVLLQGFSFISLETAQADVLFLDLNASDKEVDAARSAAQSRGERLIVIPASTAESKRKVAQLEQRLQTATQNYEPCRSVSSPECERLGRETQSIYTELDQARPTFSSEKLKAELQNLKNTNASVTSLVISGHDGGGSFSGVNGSTDNASLETAFNDFPELKSGLRSLHLWGCYTTTLGSIERSWKSSFPNLALVTGYEGVAPANTRPASWTYLEGVLRKEDEMIAAADADALQKVLKSIDNANIVQAAVCNEDSWASNERAFSITEMYQTCGEKIEKAKQGRALYDCYQKAETPECANPPDDTHSGPLRAYYNEVHDLQHCFASSRFQNAQFELPSTDKIIRLIYTKNLKKNFTSKFPGATAETDEILRELGAPESLQFGDLESLSRSELRERLTALRGFLNSRDSSELGASDQNDETLAKLGALNGFWSATNNMIMEVDSKCVPFSWVESTSSDRSPCYESKSMGRQAVTNILQNPSEFAAIRYQDAMRQIESRSMELYSSGLSDSARQREEEVLTAESRMLSDRYQFEYTRADTSSDPRNLLGHQQNLERSQARLDHARLVRDAGDNPNSQARARISLHQSEMQLAESRRSLRNLETYREIQNSTNTNTSTGGFGISDSNLEASRQDIRIAEQRTQLARMEANGSPPDRLVAQRQALATASQTLATNRYQTNLELAQRQEANLRQQISSMQNRSAGPVDAEFQSFLEEALTTTTQGIRQMRQNPEATIRQIRDSLINGTSNSSFGMGGY